MKKFFAVLLGLSVILGISVSAFALQEEAYTDDVKNIVTDSLVYINPVYEGLVTEENLLDAIEGISVYGRSEYVDTFEEAGEILREQLKERKNPVVLYYAAPYYDQQLFIDLLSAAYVHTGDPAEGDYIRFNNIGWNGSVRGNTSGGIYYLEFSYTMTYCADASQEKEVDKKVDSVISSLDLGGKNDYQKICAIYDYITETVRYDYENLNDDNYILKFGTYAALINKTAVCQGYATLFYRLALEAGVDARVITGIGNGGNHAWNIVELSDYYYNLDSTWDEGTTYYRYFLKCTKNFGDHYRDYEYDSSEFNKAYPMAQKDYDPSQQETNIVASGYCGGEGDGRNLEWVLDKDGVLTISGKGSMADYDYTYMGGVYTATTPWFEYMDDFKVLQIEKGITRIGNYAFKNCKNFTGDLVLPSTVTEIGTGAFESCTGFTGTLFLPDNLKNIESSAFFYCKGLTGNLVIPDSVVSIGSSAFSKCSGLNGTLTLGKNLEAIGNSAFMNNRSMKGDIIIPDSVKTIEGNAFYDCSGFDGKIVLGNSVETIGRSAFYYCRELKGDLIIPDSVKSIGEQAFFRCSKLDGKLVIGNGVESIGYSAFTYCLSVKELSIGSSLKIIDEYVFSELNGLRGILVIPKNVTDIKYNAFFSSGITEFRFEGDAPSVYAANTNGASFDEGDVVCYPGDNGTWVIEDGKWNGYTAVAWSDEPDVIYGDVNGDGKINVIDANLIRRYAAKLAELSEKQIAAADVDGNGRVNVLDANLIRRFAAKFIEVFPVEKK